MKLKCCKNINNFDFLCEFFARSGIEVFSHFSCLPYNRFLIALDFRIYGKK